MGNRDLVAALRSALAERADPSRAAGMQAYMKSSMPNRGVTTPVLRLIAREVFPSYPLDSFDDWQETILALWNEASFREERYAALALVRGFGARRSSVRSASSKPPTRTCCTRASSRT
jgi:hypothetical protein